MVRLILAALAAAALINPPALAVEPSSDSRARAALALAAAADQDAQARRAELRAERAIRRAATAERVSAALAVAAITEAPDAAPAKKPGCTCRSCSCGDACPLLCPEEQSADPRVVRSYSECCRIVDGGGSALCDNVPGHPGLYRCWRENGRSMMERVQTDPPSAATAAAPVVCSGPACSNCTTCPAGRFSSR
mgnify:CR=1 FL=1